MVASDTKERVSDRPIEVVRPARRRFTALPYVLLLPAAVILVGLFGAPFASLFVYALHNTELSGESTFVWFANFTALVNEEHFRENLVVTAAYLVGVLMLTVPVSYLAALVVSTKFRGVGLVRTLLLTPWVLAPVVTAVLFRTLVDPSQGPVAVLSEWVFGQPASLVTSGNGALALIIVHSVWRSVPLVMLILAAAMSGIPRELYQAVKVDGGGAVEEFRYVTLPFTRTALVNACIIISVFAVQDTESIYALTKGGPGYSTESAAVRLFKEAFLYYNVGGGAAIGAILVVLTIVLLVVLSRLSRRLEADV